MAFVFSTCRPRIADKMAAGDKELRRWLALSTFAKTANGYWLAWRKDEADRMAVLPPDHPAGEACRWLETWDGELVEDFIEHVESGGFEKDGDFVLNLFIQNPETGEWE